MDLTRGELLDAGFDALGGEAAPPAGLGDRVLGAARAGRSPGHDRWASAGLSAQQAFAETAADLARTLDGLVAADWERPTAMAGGASVRDLVLHLVGVERYILGQLGRRERIDAPTAADHFPVLRAAADDVERAGAETIARTWWQEALQLLGVTGEVGPDHPVAYHDIVGSVQGMLVVRTFELWTHDDDIRAAIGLPANVLDDARLALMSSTLLAVLPFGMDRTGATRPGKTVRIELTGPGGGAAFESALSPDDVPGEPDLVIRTSTLDLCRLASNRLPLAEVPVEVVGDRTLLEPVLVGATAFAMD